MVTDTERRLTLTIRETASLLGLSVNSTYLAVKNGAIPCLKIGARILIPKAALEKMLANAGQVKETER